MLLPQRLIRFLRSSDSGLPRFLQALGFAMQAGEEITARGLFDPEHYARVSKRRGSRTQLLLHYLVSGYRRGLTPCSSFDVDLFKQQFPYTSNNHLSPLEVYHQFGRYQGFAYSWHPDDPIRELPVPKWANVEFPAALVVHAFYLEEFSDIAARLSSGAHEVDIVVTTPHSQASIEDVLRAHRLVAKEILQFPNHGRDVFPFVHLLNSGLLNRYKLIGKVHTKRSTHRGDGSSWLDDCLTSLLRTKEVEALMQDGTVGMIAPAGRVGSKEYLEASWWKLFGLSARAGWALSRDEVHFPVGTMFWARAEALAGIAQLGLTHSDFEAEAGQLDGTMAHALERLFGVACSKSGYRLVEI